MKEYRPLTLKNFLAHYYVGVQLPKVQRKSKYNPKITTTISSLVTIVSQGITVGMGWSGDLVAKTISEYTDMNAFTISLGVAGAAVAINLGRIALTRFDIITPEISFHSPFLITYNFIYNGFKKADLSSIIKNIEKAYSITPPTIRY